MDVLRVEIEDDRNGEGEVWLHEVALDTPLGDIGKAVQTLYPGVTDIHIFVAEEEKE